MWITAIITANQSQICHLPANCFFCAKKKSIKISKINFEEDFFDFFQMQLTRSGLYKCVCGNKNVEPKSRSAIVSTSSIKIVDNGLS